MSSCANCSGFRAREELNCGGVWSDESVPTEAVEPVQSFFFVLTLDSSDPVKCGLLEHFIGQLNSPRLKEPENFSPCLFRKYSLA